MCEAAEGGAGADSAPGENGDDSVDPDAMGVAKMRASEIKAELDMRGVGYAGIFEKVCSLSSNCVYNCQEVRCRWPGNDCRVCCVYSAVVLSVVSTYVAYTYCYDVRSSAAAVWCLLYGAAVLRGRYLLCAMLFLFIISPCEYGAYARSTVATKTQSERRCHKMMWQGFRARSHPTAASAVPRSPPLPQSNIPVNTRSFPAVLGAG